LFQRADVDRQRLDLIGVQTDRRRFMIAADGIGQLRLTDRTRLRLRLFRLHL
jgi:hypothetical protein